LRYNTCNFWSKTGLKKNKNMYKIFLNKSIKLINKPLTWFAILSLILTAVASYFAITRQTTRKAEATPPITAADTIKFEKKYVKGSNLSATEVDNIFVNGGSQVPVRLKFTNSTDHSALNASITDTITPGATVVPGSFQTCISEFACVSIPDPSIVGNSFSIAPYAGKLGWAPNATTSNLELGRLVYAGQLTCDTPNVVNTGRIIFIPYYNNEYHLNSGTFTNSSCDDFISSFPYNVNPFGGNTLSSTFLQNLSVSSANYRYLNYAKCTLPGGTNAFGILQSSNTISGVTTQAECNYSVGGNSVPANSSNTFGKNLDIQGVRFFNYGFCSVPFSYNDSTASTPQPVTETLPYLVPLGYSLDAPNVSVFTNTTCQTQIGASSNAIGQVNSVYLNNISQDRGYGYVEYRMIVPTANGTYTSASSMIATPQHFVLPANNVQTTYTAQANSVVVNPQPKDITDSDINVSSNCVSSTNLGANGSILCRFTLVNTASNSYVVPAGGVYANIDTATGKSSPCYVENNTAVNVTLACDNVPATAASLGLQNLNIVFNTSATKFVKGNITIVASNIAQNVALADIQTSTDCISSRNLTIGNTDTCSFALNTSTTNNFSILAGTKASIAGATGSSPDCKLQNNGSVSVKLVCAGVPSTGSTAGNKNVNVTIASTPAIKGVINLVTPGAANSTITEANIGQSTDCFDIYQGPKKTVTNPAIFDCVFPLTGNASNIYVLPLLGIKTRTQGNSSLSSDCTIFQNGTAGAYLACTNIPSEGGYTGDPAIEILINSDLVGVAKGGVEVLPGVIILSIANVNSPTVSQTTCTSAVSKIIGDAVNCIIDLQGNNGQSPFVLPAGGIAAQISTSSNKSQCVLTNPISGSASLLCKNIPTYGATAGSQALKLFFGNSTIPEIIDNITLTTGTPASTVITDSNIKFSADCVSSTTLVLGLNKTCNYDLVGSPNNNYSLPVGGITAKIQTANTASGACTIVGNFGTSPKLQCAGIPSTGTTKQTQNIELNGSNIIKSYITITN
jgi:hypothetical protein